MGKKGESMTQIVVTIEDVSMAAKMMSAIEKMKGVIKASLYTNEIEIVEATKKEYSPRLKRMRGFAKDVKKEVTKDERLTYLLNK